MAGKEAQEKIFKGRTMNAGWERVIVVNGKLMGLREAVKHEIKKLMPIRYERSGEAQYQAVMRNPKTDPSLDEITDEIIKLVRNAK